MCIQDEIKQACKVTDLIIEGDVRVFGLMFPGADMVVIEGNCGDDASE